MATWSPPRNATAAHRQRSALVLAAEAPNCSALGEKVRYKAQRDRRKNSSSRRQKSSSYKEKFTTTTTIAAAENTTTSTTIEKICLSRRLNYKNLLVSALYLLSLISLIAPNSNGVIKQVHSQQLVPSSSKSLPDLASSTSDEPIVAIVGQDAFISCVAKNLQNYTIIWRYTNEANAPAATSTATASTSDTDGDTGSVRAQQDVETNSNILTAGRQRVISDNRFSVIQSHDTWLLKISNVHQSDTGTYVCHTNSVPIVRALRVLSVVKPGGNNSGNSGQQQGDNSMTNTDSKENWGDIDYSFADCCRAEYVAPRCQRLCSFQQLSSRYRSINIVHDCFPSLPAISRCMVGGRNVTDCCERRHIPQKCKAMCGHQGDISSMSVQDQSYCADYSASIMSCKLTSHSLIIVPSSSSSFTICPSARDGGGNTQTCSIFLLFNRSLHSHTVPNHQTIECITNRFALKRTADGVRLERAIKVVFVRTNKPQIRDARGSAR